MKVCNVCSITNFLFYYLMDLFILNYLVYCYLVKTSNFDIPFYCQTYFLNVLSTSLPLDKSSVITRGNSCTLCDSNYLSTVRSAVLSDRATNSIFLFCP